MAIFGPPCGGNTHHQSVITSDPLPSLAEIREGQRQRLREAVTALVRGIYKTMLHEDDYIIDRWVKNRSDDIEAVVDAALPKGFMVTL